MSIARKCSQGFRVEIFVENTTRPLTEWEGIYWQPEEWKRFSSVPPALRRVESGCRDGVPAGGLGAKPLRFSVIKKHIFTVRCFFSISTYISNIVYIVSSFRGAKWLVFTGFRILKTRNSRLKTRIGRSKNEK